MYRRIVTVTTATLFLALSALAQASANPGVAQDLVHTQSETPFIAMTIGETIQVAKAEKNKEKKSNKTKTQAQKAKGYEKSGNPKAAGGPQNPGKGKAQKPSNVRPEQPIAGPKPEQPIEKPKPEQPIEGVKPEQPIEKPKPEQPIAAPQPEPRGKDGTG